MVLDFGDIKTVLCKLHDVWDHGLILEGTDPLLMFLNNSKLADFQAIGFGKLFVFDCPPTAENLAAYALQFLKEALEHNGVSVDRVVFWETPTSRAIIDKDWPGSPMPLQTSEWKMPEPRIEWQP
jgi:6-pyruvoyl-tetrahydropterin synthase